MDAICELNGWSAMDAKDKTKFAAETRNFAQLVATGVRTRLALAQAGVDKKAANEPTMLSRWSEYKDALSNLVVDDCWKETTESQPMHLMHLVGLRTSSKAIFNSYAEELGNTETELSEFFLKVFCHRTLVIAPVF